jgi:hypothetical protein
MKRLLIPLLMLILLSVAGVGIAGHFGYGPATPLLYKPKPVEAPPPPKRHTIPLNDIVTPIIRKHVIERQIAMDLNIIVEDSVNSQADAKTDLILSQIRMDMLDFLPLHSDVKSPADRQAVHDRLVFIVKSVVGQEAINDVVIRTFYYR